MEGARKERSEKKKKRLNRADKVRFNRTQQKGCAHTQTHTGIYRQQQQQPQVPPMGCRCAALPVRPSVVVLGCFVCFECVFVSSSVVVLVAMTPSVPRREKRGKRKGATLPPLSLSHTHCPCRGRVKTVRKEEGKEGRTNPLLPAAHIK